MIKLASILQEIGDATSPVPYTNTIDLYNKKFDIANIEYEFEIGEDTYVVITHVDELDTSLPSNKDQRKGSKAMNVIFGIKTGKEHGQWDTARTNRGVKYKVMATVTKIIKDYIDEHPEVVDISYEPVKKNAQDQSRMKLYRAYVTKALPNWKYKETGDGWVHVTKPPQEKKGFFKSLFK